MSRVWIYICCAILVGALCSANADEIGDPNECEDYGIKLPKDKVVFIPGECMSAECVNPYINEIVYKKCSDAKPRPGCHDEEGDKSKPYPECCPKRVCKNESA